MGPSSASAPANPKAPSTKSFWKSTTTSKRFIAAPPPLPAAPPTGARFVHLGLHVNAHHVQILGRHETRLRDAEHLRDAAQILVAEVGPLHASAARGDVGEALRAAQALASGVFGVVEGGLAHAHVLEVYLERGRERQIPVRRAPPRCRPPGQTAATARTRGRPTRPRAAFPVRCATISASERGEPQLRQVHLDDVLFARKVLAAQGERAGFLASHAGVHEQRGHNSSLREPQSVGEPGPAERVGVAHVGAKGGRVHVMRAAGVAGDAHMAVVAVAVADPQHVARLASDTGSRAEAA